MADAKWILEVQDKNVAQGLANIVALLKETGRESEEAGKKSKKHSDEIRSAGEEVTNALTSWATGAALAGAAIKGISDIFKGVREEQEKVSQGMTSMVDSLNKISAGNPDLYRMASQQLPNMGRQYGFTDKEAMNVLGVIEESMPKASPEEIMKVTREAMSTRAVGGDAAQIGALMGYANTAGYNISAGQAFQAVEAAGPNAGLLTSRKGMAVLPKLQEAGWTPDQALAGIVSMAREGEAPTQWEGMIEKANQALPMADVPFGRTPNEDQKRQNAIASRLNALTPQERLARMLYDKEAQKAYNVSNPSVLAGVAGEFGDIQAQIKMGADPEYLKTLRSNLGTIDAWQASQEFGQLGVEESWMNAEASGLNLDITRGAIKQRQYQNLSEQDARMGTNPLDRAGRRWLNNFGSDFMPYIPGSSAQNTPSNTELTFDPTGVGPNIQAFKNNLKQSNEELTKRRHAVASME